MFCRLEVLKMKKKGLLIIWFHIKWLQLLHNYKLNEYVLNTLKQSLFSKFYQIIVKKTFQQIKYNLCTKYISSYIVVKL